MRLLHIYGYGHESFQRRLDDIKLEPNERIVAIEHSVTNHTMYPQIRRMYDEASKPLYSALIHVETQRTRSYLGISDDVDRAFYYDRELQA